MKTLFNLAFTASAVFFACMLCVFTDIAQVACCVYLLLTCVLALYLTNE